MSIMDALKKDLGGRKTKTSEGVAAPGSELALTGPSTSAPTEPATAAKSKGVPLALSASPRANLLPPEIGQRQRRKSARRWMRVAVFVVLVLTVAGVGGAWALSMLAQTSLAATQAESVRLAGQQAGYADVQSLQREIAIGGAAQRVGGSVEIDWQSYLNALQASLPAGVTMDTVQADSVSITDPYRVGDGPLDSTSVAELTFTAKSPTLPTIPDWLNSIAQLPGFVDANPTSVTLADDGYTTTITMHIDASVFTGRFDVKEGE